MGIISIVKSPMSCISSKITVTETNMTLLRIQFKKRLSWVMLWAGTSTVLKNGGNIWAYIHTPKLHTSVFKDEYAILCTVICQSGGSK